MTCQRQSSDLGCWMVPWNLGMKNDTNQPVSRNETTNETDLSSFPTQAKCEWDLLRAAAAASELFLQVETKQKDGQVIKGKRSSRQRRWSGRKKKKVAKTEHDKWYIIPMLWTVVLLQVANDSCLCRSRMLSFARLGERKRVQKIV